jgi:hypothetical protein
MATPNAIHASWEAGRTRRIEPMAAIAAAMNAARKTRVARSGPASIAVGVYTRSALPK